MLGNRVDDADRAYFEEIGPEAVQTLIRNGMLSLPRQHAAEFWLAEKNRQKARLDRIIAIATLVAAVLGVFISLVKP